MSLLLALLAGVQAAEPVRIDLSWDGQTCGASIDGVPVAPDALDARARQWAQEKREVSLRGADQTPYRCIGGTIYRLQMAGLVRIGFFSEPSPKQVNLVIPRGKCRVVLDGQAMALDAFRWRTTAWRRTQPLVILQPDVRVALPCFDRVLAIVKESGVQLGFLGNERDAPDEEDPKP